MRRTSKQRLSTRRSLHQGAVNVPPNGAGSRQKGAAFDKTSDRRRANHQRHESRQRRRFLHQKAGKTLADERVGENTSRRPLPPAAHIFSGTRAPEVGVQAGRRRLQGDFEGGNKLIQSGISTH